MKEEQLNTLRQQDINLRDALKMDEAELPQLPADLNSRVMQRATQQPRKATVRRIWPWLAAACVAAFIIVNVMPPKDAVTGQEKGPVAAVKVEKKVEQKAEELPKVAEPEKQQVAKVQDVTPKPASVAKPKLRKPVVEEKLLAQESASIAPVESVPPVANETVLATTDAPKAEPKMTTITERDIPITRPENYKYTPEEIALMKKQANEAYLKWAQLELEIAKHNLEQTAQK